MDKHAPLQTRTVHNRVKVPWITSDIKVAKRLKRKSEKIWIKSQSQTDKSISYR